MDDDPVLRSLGEDLARDDPLLAAMLGGPDAAPRRRGGRWLLMLLLLAPVLVVVALLVPPTVAVGAFAMLMAVGSPLAVCWLCAMSDRTAPRPH
jgi:Flp pilus assembly protein TadB